MRTSRFSLVGADRAIPAVSLWPPRSNVEAMYDALASRRWSRCWSGEVGIPTDGLDTNASLRVA